MADIFSGSSSILVTAQRAGSDGGIHYNLRAPSRFGHQVKRFPETSCGPRRIQIWNWGAKGSIGSLDLPEFGYAMGKSILPVSETTNPQTETPVFGAEAVWFWIRGFSLSRSAMT
jgi:hypothetical protein